MEKCAKREVVGIMAAHIVTRNPGDFAKSRVKVIQPEDFLKLS